MKRNQVLPVKKSLLFGARENYSTSGMASNADNADPVCEDVKVTCVDNEGGEDKVITIPKEQAEAIFESFDGKIPSELTFTWNTFTPNAYPWDEKYRGRSSESFVGWMYSDFTPIRHMVIQQALFNLYSIHESLTSFDGTANITIAPTDLTGVNATATELNIMDGGTSATSTTLADADRVVVNDAGTMKQVALTDFETYFESALDTLGNVTTVGALNSGSITSGFGSIDNGSSAITTTGTITYGSLSDGSITITGFVDEDDMSSNSATLIPTQQSVEARIQAVNGSANNVSGLTATGAELNILDDATLTTAELNILDGSATTQATVTLVATDGVVISDADVMKQALVSDFDTYISGSTGTLTNKTLTTPVITTATANAGILLKNGNTSAGFLEFFEPSGTGSNKLTLIGPASTADVTLTLPAVTGTVTTTDEATALAIALS